MHGEYKVKKTSDIVQTVDSYLLAGGEEAEILSPSLKEVCNWTLS
jgi:hypothetical protein